MSALWWIDLDLHKTDSITSDSFSNSKQGVGDLRSLKLATGREIEFVLASEFPPLVFSSNKNSSLMVIQSMSNSFSNISISASIIILGLRSTLYREGYFFLKVTEFILILYLMKIYSSL